MNLYNLFLVSVGGAIVAGIAATDHIVPDASHLGADASKAYVSVEYADTFQGTQALYAVRACSAEDRPISPAAADAVIGRELMTDTNGDVVVRVFDRDGKEISHQVGAADVCGYARMAAAFVFATNNPRTGDTK
jgi:hypothetical protein